MIKLTYYVGDYKFDYVIADLHDLVFALDTLIRVYFTGYPVKPEMISRYMETAIKKAVEVFNGQLLSFSTHIYKIERIKET